MAIRQKKRKRKGAPTLDLAHLVRNWGWCLLVKQQLGLSDWAIDEKYLQSPHSPSERDKSLFGVISRNGSTPQKRKLGGLDGKTPYDRITDSGEFEIAKRWYESDLWECLSDPHLSANDLSSYVEREACAYYQRGSIESSSNLQIDLMGPYGFRFAPGSAPGGLGPRPGFLGKSGVERVTLLCALFLARSTEFEADGNYVGYIHYWLKDSISSLRNEPPFNIDFDVDLAKCVEQLINDRIVKRRWIWKDDMPIEIRSAKPPKKRTEGANLEPNLAKRYAKWYISRPPSNFREFLLKSSDGPPLYKLPN